MSSIGIEPYLSASPVLAVGAAFAGGFVASLSPCVYPMIPIVSIYIGSRNIGASSALRSFQLSASYVIGMALVYALLGMSAALTGTMFGAISTSPWASLVVANTLLLLALNALDAVPLPSLPTLRTTDSAATGNLGALLVGAASGLVVSPCVSPVLLGLLTFISTKHSVWFGGALMLAFSFGMGALLLLVGTFSGLASKLPKPGPWMLVVKKGLGIAMLLLAEYYLAKAGQAWL